MDTKKNEWLEWGKAILVAIVLAAIVRAFLFTSYEVQGESMVPSVYDGERFIINKIGYGFSEPNRFDLIVFHANEEDDYIKRVIGLPGDKVEVKNDVLYINNEPVDEPFLEQRKEGLGSQPYTNDFAIPEVVPEGHVFVLGDNRPNSLDSRRIGFIPNDKIVGKVDLRFWPIAEAGVVK
ncbi:signal peptidase I [Halalkalibacter nanhaiisediminis]|uniref:Signal peptidase I n=1 Tax=Halalkalibacter nanhaiisediminis TaxID=688079 RepID=A0A562QHJ8_9BACI|nr:signal peptidase I [Halalkalibacter nanhaiisediminis]TWI56143.1 signal peptidase I [Halalkalibacter nanhaiisediminis]